MKRILGKLRLNRAIAALVSVAIMISTLVFLYNTEPAQAAGIVMGESTSITKQGAVQNNCGAPWINEVIFRVGVTRDKDTYLEMKNGYNIVKSNYQQKIPVNQNNTLYMLSQTLYNGIASGYGKVTIGWYAAATKTLHTEGNQEYIGRIKAIPDNNPANPGTNGVYYSVLKSYTFDTLEELANGQWKTKLNSKTEADCLNAWGYILKRNGSDANGGAYDVETRLTQFLNATGLDTNNIAGWTEAQQLEHKLRILDLLMVCYKLMPDNATHKKDWEDAIEDWIKGENLIEKPVTIVIDTAAAINPGKGTKDSNGNTVNSLVDRTGIILIGTIDFLNYVGGVETSYVLNSPFYKFVNPKVTNKSGINRTYNNILGSVQQSVNSSPSFDRISNSFTTNNAFSFSRSMLTKYSLYTTNNVAKWSDTSVLASYIDVLQIKDVNQAHEDVSGFMFVLTAPIGKTSLNIKVQAKPDNEIIPPGAQKLGREATILVEPKPTNQQISLLKPLIDLAKKNGKNIEVTYDIKRTYLGNTVTTSMSQTKKYTPDAFLALIQNGSETFIDTETAVIDVSNVEIVRVGYTVNMSIAIEGKSIKCTGTDEASFKIRIEHTGGQYTSKPTAYAEIKEGSPYNETFEAMAGVPSTEKLYFAAGGSEFIVDIQTSYVQNAKAERTYHSYYTGTDCEYKIGDTAGDYTVPTPVGATSSKLTVNAHTGGTVSASWTYTVKNESEASELTGYSEGSAGSPCVGSGYNAGSPGDITWVNKWDAKTYNDAVKNAKKWQTDLNNFIIKHTSESDKKERTWNSWGASLTGNSWGDSITETQWESYTKTMGQAGKVSGYVAGCGHGCTKTWDVEPSEGNPGKSHSHTHNCGTFTPATKTTVTKVSDKTFTITVTATLPPHMVCGPCCTHVLPDVHDTWKQEVTFDHLKIDEVHIWKIDQAAVGGMREITGTDEIKAKIVSGDPNYFLNIAATETSAAGRLRYTVEPRQHDAVTWNEGVRTAHCNGLGNNGVSSGNGHASAWADGILYNNTAYPNQKDYEVSNSDAKDKLTTEYAKFKSRRETQNKVTVISDMLILQTSSGDQSVIYFQKESQSKQTQENIPKVGATWEEMWDNNPNSAAKWSQDEINIGSYNGKYNSPSTKYNGDGGNKIVSTIFDSDPAGTIVRKARPSRLFLYQAGINQIVTNDNKAYIIGDAEVFWKYMYSYKDKNTAPYDTASKPKYGANGHVETATYSDDTTKVNDIVVHNPVSAEDAMVIGLDPSRDQRVSEVSGSADDLTDKRKALAVCPRDPGLCEFRVENCTYYDDVTVAMFTFENGAVNNITGKEYQLPAGFTIENVNRFGTGKSLSAKGTRWSIPLTDLGISYNPRTKVLVEANINIPQPSGSTGGTMIVSFYAYDFWVMGGSAMPTWNTGRGAERQSTTAITNKNLKLGLVFDFGDLYRNKMYVDGVEQTGYITANDSNPLTVEVIGNSINIGSWGVNNDYPANFYLDNLKIVRLGGTSSHTTECYTSVTFHPEGNNAHTHSADCVDSILHAGNNEVTTFNYTGNVQEYVAPVTGAYKLELWGAQGGGNVGGFGGYATGKVNLTAGQKIYIYVGGRPQGETATGGWNGGGEGGLPGSTQDGLNNRPGKGGGGATDVRIGGTALTNRIIVAGGGGGSAGSEFSHGTDSGRGGVGGGATGGAGTRYPATSTEGLGGTQYAGGAAGTGGSNNATAGSLGIGGRGSNYGGGGGGGGYYGGGGGGGTQSYWNDGSGGGGGSGYIGGVSNGRMTSGVRSGHGMVKIHGPSPEAISGVEYVAELINSGDTAKAKDMLGPVYNLLSINWVESLIYRWTFEDTVGTIVAKNNVTIFKNNDGQLVFRSTGTDPQCETPVHIEAKAVSKIRIHFDNTTNGATGQIYYRTSNGSYSEANSVTYPMNVNQSGQVVTLDMTKANGWQGTIDYLRFDFSNGTAGDVRVSVIEFYGYGTGEMEVTPLSDNKYVVFGPTGSGRTGGVTSGYRDYGLGPLTTIIAGGSYFWNVPFAGMYTIEAFGAQGGGSNIASGGRGARMKGDFFLAAGEQLKILVGQEGKYAVGGGGGGGGTFVTRNEYPLIVAGGGGGASGSVDGNHGLSTIGNGSGGVTPSGSYPGGGGGGFSTNGSTSYGGRAFQYGGEGGYAHSNASSAVGGYGGGGGNGWYGGGGGGGYQGGNGGKTDAVPGDGGLSYNIGSNQSNESGYNTGHGQVIITAVGTVKLKIVEDMGGYITIETLRTVVKNNYTSLPKTLSDGSPNPIWACENILGNGSTIGSIFDNPTINGAAIINVTHPKTGKTVKAIRLNGGVEVPYIWSSRLKLVPNEQYILEFDYWSDADGVRFNVDIHPDDLPEIYPVANRSVQHYKWEFSSSSDNMKDCLLRVFNDRMRPNPANVYVTNIRLIKKSHYDYHMCTASCYSSIILNCNEPHHFGMHYDGSNDVCWDACGNDDNHFYFKPTVKDSSNNTVSAGSFINLDYDFEIYFPNIGDFDQGQAYGLRTITTQRGKGYVDNMDTTKWTKTKRVRFNFNVIYKGDGKLYLAGEWIDLPVNASRYGFYCVLANGEAKSAEVQFEVEAINCPGSNDNTESPTNRTRYADYTARHGGRQSSYIDIVGRIGNLVVSDTGDYRFSNFFKVPNELGKWVVDGVVREVHETIQNLYFGSRIDIRGETISAAGEWLNTYGTQSWLNKEPVELPISPDKNNIASLRTQSLRVGYDILADITTIGNYQSRMEVTPRYYVIKSKNFEPMPIDVYMLTNGEYKLINTHDLVQTGWNRTTQRLVKETEIGAFMREFNGSGAVITDVEMPGTQKMVKAIRLNKGISSPIAWTNALTLNKNVNYTIEFDCWTDSGETYMGVDLYPDDLPQVAFRATTEVKHYKWVMNSGSNSLNECYLRFFESTASPNPCNIYITNIRMVSDTYPYVISLNWDNEKGRRNYDNAEKLATDTLAAMYKEFVLTPDANGDWQVTGEREMDRPVCTYYPLGTAQLLDMAGKARTFIGSGSTNGINRNIGSRIALSDWWYAAQRWHFKVGLPSSSVFVEYGKPATKEEIDKLTNPNYVVIATADIKAIGDTFTLKYTPVPNNGKIIVEGSTYNLPDGLPPVLAVYSTEYTARHDVDIKGTH